MRKVENMKKIYLFNLLAVLALTLVSCQENEKEDIPENNETKTTIWLITEVSTNVEMEGESGTNQEIIEQIENEIEGKMNSLGNKLTFHQNAEDLSTGELIRTHGDGTAIKSTYRFEALEDNLHYLIINDGEEEEKYQVTERYLVKDFSKEYKSADLKITSALGFASFIRPL